MDSKLVDRVVAGPRIKLSDLTPGDRVMGFEGWKCVPDNSTRKVHRDRDGALFVICRCGKHMLDGQEDDDGVLLGMIKL